MAPSVNMQKSNTKHLKCREEIDITGWVESEVSIQIGQPVYTWENFYSNGNIAAAKQQL